MAYLSLWLTAFIAATLMPMGSEALLVTLVLQTELSVGRLILVASLGNVAGSLVNYWLGLYLQHWRHRSWFPFKQHQLDKAERQYQRFGFWTLLLSWAPIIGDPLTLVAGVMREPWWRFLLLVSIAKTGRYTVLVWLVLGWA